MVAQAAIPIFRALGTAYQQALHNARREGATAAKEALKPKRGVMTQSEAVDILHIDAADAKNAAVISERYDKLFGMNDPEKGGSFYLQSKIFRAHEALMADLEPRDAGAGSKKAEEPKQAGAKEK
eukprot:CAMPEP_0119264168 /NCGR_PEP_ID=MMETSP1329-20130426/3324_1 /TAXON_ID=114041 /ORGANISM="Genus nov. species nov., Strain RCC1024" /LENGTH=124 /DNA_ID=CAMNT_0007263913 /DNA_START=190 /DNA_END=561 /DNA_ORIENTATION=-